MKVLAPAVTCILTSHMRPTLEDAIGSLLAQTRLDFEVIIADSGAWIGRSDAASMTMARMCAMYSMHPLITWVTTGERPGIHERKCPFTWAVNNVIRSGLVHGRYVCYFYDDDLYKPTFMERMAGYLDTNPGKQAVMCFQDRWTLHEDGSGEERPGFTNTGNHQGATFDCQVDGAQIMHRREVLDLVGDPWWPEDPDWGICNHADGLFLNKLGVAVGHEVEMLPEPLETHRYTWLSTYTPANRAP